MSVRNFFANGSGRQIVRKIYLAFIYFYFRLFNQTPNSDACIVFAPHQDDETLGSGGTIIQKKRKGADVKIVFMTDGNNSHKHLFPDDLKDIRRSEAIAACKVLGIDEQDVIFFDNEDGKLSECFENGVGQVLRLIAEVSPKEVYIPYIGDHHPDHKATNKIVLAALKQSGQRFTVYEYPTWFWDYWPIVEIGTLKKGVIKKKMDISLSSISSTLRDLRCSVKVSDVIGIKHDALYKHTSQLTRMNKGDKWFILGDVSHGDWLERFFQPIEVFYKYTVSEKTER